MLAWLDRLRLRQKIWLAVSLFFVIVLAGSIHDLLSVRAALAHEKALQTRHLVEAAHALLAYYRQGEISGELSAEVARARAIEALRALRYDNHNYFWINDLSFPAPRMIMHATLPELEGQVLDAPVFDCATSEREGAYDGPVTYTDGHKNLFLAMGDVVRRAGHGYVTYDWPKPLPDGGVSAERYPKLSYVRLFADWGWVVGSGVYLDDVEEAVRTQLWRHLAGLSSLAAALVLTVLLLQRALAPLGRIVAEFEAIASGQQPLHPLPIERDDEVGELIAGFNRLQYRLASESAALQRSDALLLQAQRLANLGHFVYQPASGCWQGSAMLDAILGIGPDYLRDRAGWLALFDARDREAVAAWLQGQQMPGDDLFDRECRINRVSDGLLRWVRLCGRSAVDGEAAESGGGAFLFGVLQDISERKAIEEKQRLAASVFTSTREGIIITDHQARILEVNEAFTRISGYERSEVIGKNPSLLKSGRQGAEFYQAMWRDLSEKGYWSGEIWNRHRSGLIYAELLTISAVRDDAGEISHYVGVFADITPLKEHEDELDRMAHFDALTGLPNRVLLEARLHQAMQQSRRAGTLLAVCYIDLDGFKPVNDTLGHEAGDRLLVEMAGRMAGTLRAGDTLARIGGDEFVVLLLGLEDPADAAPAVDRLLEVIAVPVELLGQQLMLSASIGVAFFPHDDTDAETLLRHADQAMYRAKQGGRNRQVWFDAGMERRRLDEVRLQEGIDAALAGGGFELLYQPWVDMRRAEVLGFEALIHWRRGPGELVPAEAFPPGLVEEQAVVRLGEWAIGEALAQLAAWRADGRPWMVSVNVAAHHLLQADFVRRLREALARHPEFTGGLVLELREDVADADVQQAKHVIGECAALGVGCLLDAYGSGPASLAVLKSLPVQALKLEAAWVRAMASDPEALAIVEGIVELGRIFQREVIANGVEFGEQALLLLAFGCERAQGQAIAPALPAGKVADWIARWQADDRWRQTGRFQPARADLPLLMAEGSYRRWVEDLAAYVGGTRALPPEDSDAHHCRFGHWYEGRAAAHHRLHPAYALVGRLHEELHVLGHALILACQEGRREEARARLPELAELRDRLGEALRELVIEAAPGSGDGKG